MHPADLLDRLLDLAREAGLEVRQPARAVAGEGEPGAHSGVCRVRDRVWVVLVGSDALEERIDVLAGALATHSGDTLESRYLPPAVRDRIQRPAGRTGIGDA